MSDDKAVIQQQLATYNATVSLLNAMPLGAAGAMQAVGVLFNGSQQEWLVKCVEVWMSVQALREKFGLNTPKTKPGLALVKETTDDTP